MPKFQPGRATFSSSHSRASLASAVSSTAIARTRPADLGRGGAATLAVDSMFAVAVGLSARKTTDLRQRPQRFHRFSRKLLSLMGLAEGEQDFRIPWCTPG